MFDEKISKVLGLERSDVQTMNKILSKASGQKDILKKVFEQNEEKVRKNRGILGVQREEPEEVFNALLKKIKADNEQLKQLLNNPICDTEKGCRDLLNTAKRISEVGDGFFLKTEKAKEFLLNTPPENIIKTLGYKNAEELVENEDVFEVFSALRFVEDGEWMNTVFFKQYENLTPEDFEERKIKTIVLSERWEKIAEEFLKKKFHNISHLKELGVIFVLPAVSGVQGEELRTLGLILHYFHEIDFYSNLFRKYSRENNFTKRMLASLRGDVSDKKLGKENFGKTWVIIQRYLAKDDKKEWRLFQPHINPEAMHWRKAENDLSKLDKEFEELNFSFWEDVDWVGNNFGDELVSFNLVDIIMSLVDKEKGKKYIYHQQEALWNKIFYEAFGEGKMEQMMNENFEKGYIEL
ncbi:MAG: hypothetical protein ABII97_02400 [Patescibacteria group bacterium]